MNRIISLDQLLQKPVCYMSGEELAYLINNIGVLTGKSTSGDRVQTPDKKLAYGIRGIAETFGCSIPTANRIKKSGVIDKAISQVGRKIVLDVELALELAGSINKEG